MNGKKWYRFIFNDLYIIYDIDYDIKKYFYCLLYGINTMFFLQRKTLAILDSPRIGSLENFSLRIQQFF